MTLLFLLLVALLLLLLLGLRCVLLLFAGCVCSPMFVCGTFQTNEQELLSSVKVALMSAGREYWDEFTKVGGNRDYGTILLLIQYCYCCYYCTTLTTIISTCSLVIVCTLCPDLQPQSFIHPTRDQKKSHTQLANKGFDVFFDLTAAEVSR